MIRALWNFLFPRSPWHGCQPPTDAERLAQWEIRRGRERATQRLRAARVQQVFDLRAGVRAAINPKLP
ncbi:MAG: hypothetical protein ACREPT_00815 [Rudaea sp.]